jgi:NAD(P)-dependent dehydrogenase (short-subunit alcohol dehydrogenase family)
MTEQAPGKLAGRAAVVTGGASGLGRGIVLAYAREGAQVAIVDRDGNGAVRVAEEASAAGGTARAFTCDVSQADDVECVVADITSSGERIDILVNSAGISRTAAIADMDVEQWHEVIGINLTGTFLMTRAVVRKMLTTGGGRIINVASQLGILGAPQFAHYCASKAGVLGMTRALARELIGSRIHVNAIAPGPIVTPMLAAAPAESLARIYAEIPIGRPATVEEVVPTAVLLATNDGDYYVGATLNVSGGHVM